MKSYFLRNCILCDSKAEIYSWKEDGIGDVRCTNKDCRFNRGIVDSNGFSTTHFSGKYRRSKKEAINNWNAFNKWT